MDPPFPLFPLLEPVPTIAMLAAGPVSCWADGKIGSAHGSSTQTCSLSVLKNLQTVLLLGFDQSPPWK